MLFYSSDMLRSLRNRVPIGKVITSMLNMELNPRSRMLRFRCPICYNFHTAINEKTNLARCFDCKRNFNPIDMVMQVGGLSFVDAVEFLKEQWGDF